MNKIEMEMDKEFKKNKENIFFRLVGDDKYYYANQCKDFENNIKKFGWHRIQGKDIANIYFNKYSIELVKKGESGHINIQRFNKTEYLKGFVEGYNAFVFMQETNELRKKSA